MARVFVKAYASARDALGGSGKIFVELSQHGDVRFLLEILSKQFGQKFVETVLDESGSPKKMFKIFVNGRDIDFHDGLATVLNEGDEVALVPPVAGGCF
ncbi:MAG: MoaD/ThiS family protein [Candidatus Caldarchaeum sp.]